MPRLLKRPAPSSTIYASIVAGTSDVDSSGSILASIISAFEMYATTQDQSILERYIVKAMASSLVELTKVT
jgi:hypothetical protein